MNLTVDFLIDYQLENHLLYLTFCQSESFSNIVKFDGSIRFDNFD